ncbi:hypothetical protein [Bradyrhizobium sp. LjRoot220]|uniref:hypothetical protein n=1 Tax=Bradyrhizobium sp. LjRoot220 TaxID=3342284 RepID=UPI003F4F9798
MTPLEQRQEPAIYQAGRTIVACSLGLKVCGMAIIAVRDLTLGEVDVEERQSMSLIDRIALYSAGTLADRMFSIATPVSPAFADIAEMRHFMEGREQPVGSGLREIAYNKSEGLLRQHRDKVARLADPLSDRLVLSEAEIAALWEERPDTQ